MIKFEQVSKQFNNGTEALLDVNFEIAQSELVFLSGHSGAGKSTLLKLIGLLEQPTSGKIFVANQDLSKIPARKIPYYRRRIGMIFQNPLLLSQYTVYENVLMSLIVAGFDKHDMAKRVRAALDKVGLLKKEKVKAAELSSGECQRVAIARAIVHKPILLLADEPTGNLDPALSLEIMQLFARFQQVGVTIVIATHDQSLIQTMPYRRLYLKQGKVIDQSLVTPFEGYPNNINIVNKNKKGLKEYEKEKG
jgi:cell division transport system ATP-binding protein